MRIDKRDIRVNIVKDKAPTPTDRLIVTMINLLISDCTVKKCAVKDYASAMVTVQGNDWDHYLDHVGKKRQSLEMLNTELKSLYGHIRPVLIKAIDDYIKKFAEESDPQRKVLCSKCQRLVLKENAIEKNNVFTCVHCEGGVE